MQAAHRVAKNTGILYARMAITMFISLYATRMVLAALGVADFGLFNVVGGIIAMLGFLNSSMASATQRFMSFAQGAGDPGGPGLPAAGGGGGDARGLRVPALHRARPAGHRRPADADAAGRRARPGAGGDHHGLRRLGEFP